MNARVLPDLSAAPIAAVPSLGRRGGRPRRISAEAVKRLADEGKTIDEVMASLGCSRATVVERGKEAGVVWRQSRRGRPASGGRRMSRHAPHKVVGPATMPPVGHPAFAEARTLYPEAVMPVDGLNKLLVDGFNSRKIGSPIVKGRWKGMPVYTLTLEERRTCPTSCDHWRSCYGNTMHWARRIVHGPAFEARLGHELAVLASRHCGGFAVRLHVLGDFYSAAYVERWRGWLAALPGLHVFGFTARWDCDGDPIARALLRLVVDAMGKDSRDAPEEPWPGRFAIRFSNAPTEACTTVSIEHPLQKPADAIICPQQLGRTESCATCGLCWQTKRRIAFLRH